MSVQGLCAVCSALPRERNGLSRRHTAASRRSAASFWSLRVQCAGAATPSTSDAWSGWVGSAHSLGLPLENNGIPYFHNLQRNLPVENV